MINRPIFALVGTLLLSACASGAPPMSMPQSQPRVAVRVPATVPPPKPRVLAVPGLDGVIGAAPDDLIRQFGPARLDVVEGDARKLQFAGTACVLDIYLYPEAPGRVPEATYVEARRASDGQEVDRVACVTALRGK